MSIFVDDLSHPTTYKISIANNSAEVIHLVFNDPAGKKYDVTDVSPNSKVEKIFSFEGEGSVSCHVNSKSFDQSKVCIGYITSGLGAQIAWLEVQADGQIKFEELSAD